MQKQTNIQTKNKEKLINKKRKQKKNNNNRTNTGKKK